jgi:hypothetical protein
MESRTQLETDIYQVIDYQIDRPGGDVASRWQCELACQ